jgi:hypothetical protein
MLRLMRREFFRANAAVIIGIYIGKGRRISKILHLPAFLGALRDPLTSCLIEFVLCHLAVTIHVEVREGRHVHAFSFFHLFRQ